MRVSVRSSDARRARALQDALRDAGVEAMAIVGPTPTRGHVVEDIAILDAAPEARDWAMDEARRLARATPGPGSIVAASAIAAPPPAECAAFDGWVQIDAAEGLIDRELRAIRRHSEARMELAQRLRTARALAIQPKLDAERPAWRALYIGEPSPFYLAQERALTAKGGRLEAAFSSFMGFDFLHDDRFDAVTLNALNDSATALALCGALRRNARLHHLPTALIARRGDKSTIASAVERGAALIAYPDDAPEGTLAWLFEKIERGRHHGVVEAQLAQLRTFCGGASSANVSADFMRAHVERLADAAHARARPLSLVALRLASAPGARLAPAAAWARNVREIAGLAARLVRVNDTTALMSDDVILTALPDARTVEGKRLAERVVGVVECTAFASGEGDCGPVMLERSVVELAPGESGGALLARAIDPFVLEGARA